MKGAGSDTEIVNTTASPQLAMRQEGLIPTRTLNTRGVERLRPLWRGQRTSNTLLFFNGWTLAEAS
jgi:hypothetical protein